jgi:hypothetical protein
MRNKRCVVCGKINPADDWKKAGTNSCPSIVCIAPVMDRVCPDCGYGMPHLEWDAWWEPQDGPE